MKHLKTSMMALALSLLVPSANAALVAHWTFDEGAGGTAADSSGASLNHDLSLNGSYSWSTSGKFGNAVNTAVGAYGVMNTDNVDLGANWTISAWFMNYHSTGDWNTLTRGAGGDHQILGQAGGVDILGSYDNGVSGWNPNDGGFALSSLSSNVWHHVAAVGSAGMTDFYINGALVGTSAFQSMTDVHWIGGQGSAQSFAGSLDDVAIWDEALSAADIASLQTNTADNAGATASVPTPATTALLGLGLLWLRRRHSK